MCNKIVHTKLIQKTKLSTKYHKHHYFSVAPMLHLTDRHCRYFHRLLTKKALLYTEMITTNAIIYGKNNYLTYNEEEHPIALQLGGNEPKILANCAKMVQKAGYDEINFNIGCPSKRAQNGQFGAYLMRESSLVADCIKSMQDVVTIPITIKTRLGVDNDDSYEFLIDFIDRIVTNSQCRLFIIHARKAWLSGLNPKQNRKIPPLNYSYVYQLKKEFPQLTIIINGGIKTINEANQHLYYLDGVMIGREAYQNPQLLINVDLKIFNKNNLIINPIIAVQKMFPYIARELKKGTYLHHITKHMLGIFQSVPGACKWRRYLSTNSYKKGADISIIKKALEFIINKIDYL
ncbi:putative tRNA-dihydrouridine synthase [Candidatus Arsenophonus lipoptenae]|uniref:tRNA-dihydrouridine(20/20a) synthase n=1 Tax=Candidatus Arsenophonus lipoptenae TaxID=634113 RepID=A0A109Q7D4_9GAMM|nr:tRNA dihydrouridine(20/20a) synthase DusA [Candidatus Arsenophonus lipoptenae]AMA64814.1 putative tRNA-dihydrouridine synthase [Candidatus Arsenophonus lipoptenae]